MDRPAHHTQHIPRHQADAAILLLFLLPCLPAPAPAKTHHTPQPGDKIVQISASFGTDVWEAQNYGQIMYAIRTRNGTVYMKLKRNFGDMKALQVGEGESLDHACAGAGWGAASRECRRAHASAECVCCPGVRVWGGRGGGLEKATLSAHAAGSAGAGQSGTELVRAEHWATPHGEGCVTWVHWMCSPWLFLPLLLPDTAAAAAAAAAPAPAAAAVAAAAAAGAAAAGAAVPAM
jgi:hypothetical protein